MLGLCYRMKSDLQKKTCSYPFQKDTVNLLFMYFWIQLNKMENKNIRIVTKFLLVGKEIKWLMMV